MPVTSPYVFYVDDTAYDLRKVVSWYEPSPQLLVPVVYARFLDTPEVTVEFDRSDFEAAMQLAVV